jgi:hypothetical protein
LQLMARTSLLKVHISRRPHHVITRQRAVHDTAWPCCIAMCPACMIALWGITCNSPTETLTVDTAHLQDSTAMQGQVEG